MCFHIRFHKRWYRWAKEVKGHSTVWQNLEGNVVLWVEEWWEASSVSRLLVDGGWQRERKRQLRVFQNVQRHSVLWLVLMLMIELPLVCWAEVFLYKHLASSTTKIIQLGFDLQWKKFSVFLGISVHGQLLVYMCASAALLAHFQCGVNYQLLKSRSPG